MEKARSRWLETTALKASSLRKASVTKKSIKSTRANKCNYKSQRVSQKLLRARFRRTVATNPMWKIQWNQTKIILASRKRTTRKKRWQITRAISRLRMRLRAMWTWQSNFVLPWSKRWCLTHRFWISCHLPRTWSRRLRWTTSLWRQVPLLHSSSSTDCLAERGLRRWTLIMRIGDSLHLRHLSIMA